MSKRLLLVIGLLVGMAAPVWASEGILWVHFLLGGLEEPLAHAGIDPVPVLNMLVIFVFLVGVAYIGGKPFRQAQMVEPSGRLSTTHLMEVVVSGLLNFLGGIIRHGVGPRPILPLLGTYFLFILCMNLSGLIPGFGAATDQFNVTLAFGLIIFIATHFLGIKKHGSHYIQQFLGPVPWLAPLMFPIELISHCVRPLSLAVRLFGNMTGDHQVVFVFTSILAILLPVPFLLLGTLVSVLQAFVFVILSAIYFEMAMSEAH